MSSIFGLFYNVEFKFNSATFSLLTSILLDFKKNQIAKEEAPDQSKEKDEADRKVIETYKKRVNLFGTLTYATVNDLVHLIDLVHSKFVEIIIDGTDVDQLIENSIKSRKIQKVTNKSKADTRPKQSSGKD